MDHTSLRVQDQSINYPMAYHQVQVDYLKKVGGEGFNIIEKHYGRGNNQRYATAPAPAPAPLPARDQKLAPNQYQTDQPYSYQEPDQEAGYAPVKEPAFRGHRSADAAKQGYETWYFIRMPQAKTTEIEINSKEAAEQHRGILFVDYGHKTKPYRRGYN